MTRFAALLSLVLTQGAISASVFAAEPSESLSEPAVEPEEGPPPQANGRILSLGRGDRAPWTGMLIEQSDLVRWRLEIDNLQFRLDRDVQFEADKCQVNIDYYKRALELEAGRTKTHDELWKQRAEDLGKTVVAARKDAAKARQRGFFDEPVVWFVGGIVVAGALLAGGVVASK